MNLTLARNFGFLMLLLIYNFFFWHEGLGINLLIFSSVVTGFLFLLYQPDDFTIGFLVSLAGTFITGIMVVWNNSMTSKVVHILSLMITISFIQEGRWRSLIYSCLSVVKNFFAMPVRILLRQREKVRKQPRLHAFFRILRLSLVPLLVAFIFYVLYSLANPVFHQLASSFIDQLWALVDELFIHISLARILFILLGS